jgi:hypothetical protein
MSAQSGGTMFDHPHIRAGFTCPLCGGVKDQELLVCLGCHHEVKAANAGCYGPTVEKLLDRRELEDERYEKHYADLKETWAKELGARSRA